MNYCLIIHILSFKQFDNCAQYQKMAYKILTLEKLAIYKIQALEKVTTDNIHVLQTLPNKNNKNVTDKIQASENLLIKIFRHRQKFRAESTPPLHYEIEEKLSNVIIKSNLIYSLTIQDQPPNESYCQGYGRTYQNPIEMLDLMRFKEAIVSSITHSPSVRQILYSRATSNRIIPQDQKNFAIKYQKVILSYNGRLGGKMKLESSNNELGQEVLIAGVDYADLQRQSIYDKYTLVL